MKTPFLLIAGLFSLAIFAQRSTDCQDPPRAEYDFTVNNISTKLLTGGDLWWDGSTGAYLASPDADRPAGSIFAGGLWMAGKDPGGGIKLSAQRYGRGAGHFDYSTGPLNENGSSLPSCEDWDRFFAINRQAIDLLLEVGENFPIATSVIPVQVLGWPAMGNPHFAGVHGFSLPDNPQGYAPFFDRNQDGIYDPQFGDYPLFCGDEAVWFIYNDARINEDSGVPSILQFEVQVLVYAFAQPEDELLNNTIFYDYKLINRSFEDVLDLFAGHWVDVDLGCIDNDYLSSDPERNMFFAYNREAVEPENCPIIPGLTSYGDLAPAQIFKVMSSSPADTDSDLFHKEGMHSFNAFYSGAFDSPVAQMPPVTSQEYYRYLNGRWRDGSSIQRGGIGYDPDGTDTTMFLYDGGMVDGVPWYPCEADFTFSDYQSIYSVGPYALRPGGIAEFTLATTTIYGLEYGDDDCPDFTRIQGAADELQAFFDDNCGEGALNAVDDYWTATELGLEVFPNPTTNHLNFRLPPDQEITGIEIIDARGQQLRSYQPGASTFRAELDLPSGLYYYRLRTEGGKWGSGKVVVD